MSDIPFAVKVRAAFNAARHAISRAVAPNPHRARVVAWLFIDERRRAYGIAPRTAKKTIKHNGTWICIHYYPILGERQLFWKTIKANGKIPMAPTVIDPQALADCMLPPEPDEWKARFAGPFGEWPPVEDWIRVSVAALATVVKEDDDWLKTDVQLE